MGGFKALPGLILTSSFGFPLADTETVNSLLLNLRMALFPAPPPPHTHTLVHTSWSAVRVMTATSETAHSELSASPRKPNVCRSCELSGAEGSVVGDMTSEQGDDGPAWRPETNATPLSPLLSYKCPSPQSHSDSTHRQVRSHTHTPPIPPYTPTGPQNH